MQQLDYLFAAGVLAVIRYLGYSLLIEAQRVYDNSEDGKGRIDDIKQ